ncbi:MAG TPA: glucosidase [Candidatus Dormibacteraeota bacterium]|nr:glucosidase [Candidatus Dormibacteraeota bacterium]
MTRILTIEDHRLEEARLRKKHWKRWGPYLAERQWGTVREDYSKDGSAWESFPFEHAHARAYRWGEDGIGGLCDRHQMICFALALWNGRDPILKERLFGLTGKQGNHGEDVKEYYFYLDSTPTHSYMRMLYKYPQAEFPYAQLLEENQRRGRSAPEFELLDTGIFEGNRYFDVFVEYAKPDVEDILIKITAINRGPEVAVLHLLPTLWFRNTWSWGMDLRRPIVRKAPDTPGAICAELQHWEYGKRWLLCAGQPTLLFTENETNHARIFNSRSRTPYVKDAFHEWLIHGNTAAVNPERTGTKVAAHYPLQLGPGDVATLKLRLTDLDPLGGMDGDSPMVGTITSPAHQERAEGVPGTNDFAKGFDALFVQRQKEADEFYSSRLSKQLSSDAHKVIRQAYAGMLWCKQFYHYDVHTWLDGDPAGPAPPEERWQGRNKEWTHLYNDDVISMPDKWEYPWYAAWDLAFHTIPLALVDPDYAKDQLILLLREWYMHPNGQLPAYEWALGDVNPPVHAWAAWRVYKIERRVRGVADRAFLERIFHKLLLNFTWWVNRKDPDGRNIFQGGFLGLDNIGLFDRSAPVPTGGHLEQSDGTSWMGMYCLNMLAIALELAKDDQAYEDVASKFFEHFVHIAHAMNDIGANGRSLWDAEDGFYYDLLHLPDGKEHFLKIRSMVGLIPLFAVETLEPEIVDRLPGFKRRMQWFIDHHPDVPEHIEMTQRSARGVRRLLSLANRKQLKRVLWRMLDETEFLSPYGVRALSRYHLEHPYEVQVNNHISRVDYEPAESTTGVFGGNSNWRGPVWFPMNYLLIESLQKYHHYYGEDFKVECPTHSSQESDLWQVATEISRRLTRIFLPDKDGRRPFAGAVDLFNKDPHWRDLVLFYEYFHGDNGTGIGASHQTGWTGLVAKLLEQSGE